MKVKTHLSLAQTAREAMRGQAVQERTRKQGRTPWKVRPTRAEKQRTIKPALYAACRVPEQRAAHVEVLRAQVKAGTYRLDSRALAEKMMLGLSYDEGNF
ncbi:MAG TPA: flagellar biosynthesis anti-sigma factor FlgM [Ktedonobacteraceae bacterium]|nr:flagellar biosynthesis anti-sigma factor FlgM [Ktedonobacteraceae bacterium]